ncbi:MAG: peptidase M50 [Oscillospiraceae bacterium]
MRLFIFLSAYTLTGGDEMISVEVKNIKLGVSFSFFALTAIMCILGNSSSEIILTILLCSILHESGHLTMMFIFSKPPESIVLYGGGIKITPDNSMIISKSKEIAILSAGCVTNLLTAVIAMITSSCISYFVLINIMLAAFNLMPIKYSDGGRMLAEIFDDKIWVRIIRYIFIAFMAAVIIILLLRGMFSISMTLTFIYVVISEFFL